MLGLSKNFTKAFDPIIQILRPVSPLAWLPLGMVLFSGLRIADASGRVTFGTSDAAALFTIAICAMWPTVLNTAVGVRAVPQDYLNVAKVLKLSRTKTLFKILFPSALPYMFTGFRLSLGIAWLVIVPYLPDFPFKNHCSLITAHSALPLGIAAIFTSVMIYHNTHRSLWRFPRTALRFFGTTACFAALMHPPILAVVILLKLIPELLFLLHAKETDSSPDQHSARLQLGPLRSILYARIACSLLAIPVAVIHPFIALPLLLAAEIFERQVFFQSVQAPKMPGNFGPPTGSH